MATADATPPADPMPPRGAVIPPLLLLVSCLALVTGCGIFRRLPEATPPPNRIATFPAIGAPVSAPVEVRWNQHLVPFVTATTDRDCAVAIGMIHAHLRLGHMEMMRRVAFGRLAESFGILAVDFDRAIRILDLDQAADEIIARFPPHTRVWLAGFLDGVNHVQDHLAATGDLPHEFRVMELTPERWSQRDLIAIARLAAMDFNWFDDWARLGMWQEDGYEDFDRRRTAMGASAIPSGPGGGPLARLLASAAKSGSNAFVVHAERSHSGGALLGSDPHLGLSIPNLWLAIGYRSPSYQVTGLMIPGLPAVAVGRNPDLAWGGTSMRALVSDLYRLSPEQVAAAREERTALRVRLWPDREVVRRVTPWGPIITDIPDLGQRSGEALALRWVGHGWSDEFTAMLAVNRAGSIAEMQQAYRGYHVAGQTMLGADASGSIGQVCAVGMPVRDSAAAGLFIKDADNPNHQWNGVLDATGLPLVLNPPGGWIGSANNPPVVTDPPLGTYTGGNERFERMGQLLGGGEQLGLEDLARAQQDVTSPIARRLAAALAERAPDHGPAAALGLALGGWDGTYHADSTGAWALEVVRARLLKERYSERYGERTARYLAATTSINAWLLEDLTAGHFDDHLDDLLVAAARDWNPSATWGQHRRLRLAHPFADLPLVGGRYRFLELPAHGAATTLYKSATAVSDQEQTIAYGANARFLADLADPDANRVVILGGNDGRLGSPALLDQVTLWRQDRYLTLPLRPASITAAYPWVTSLRPVE